MGYLMTRRSSCPPFAAIVLLFVISFPATLMMRAQTNNPMQTKTERKAEDSGSKLPGQEQPGSTDTSNQEVNTQSETPPPGVDVTLRVKEKDKYSISLSGGISAASGSFLEFRFATHNLMGYGEALDFALQVGTRQSSFDFTFTEPYFRNRPLTTGINVFHRRISFRESDTVLGLSGGVSLGSKLFDQKTSGFSVFASYPVKRLTRLGITYRLDQSSTEFFSEELKSFYIAFQFSDRLRGIDSYRNVTRSSLTPALT
jgi:outer membrane protein insertion porin family